MEMPGGKTPTRNLDHRPHALGLSVELAVAKEAMHKNGDLILFHG